MFAILLILTININFSVAASIIPVAISAKNVVPVSFKRNGDLPVIQKVLFANVSSKCQFKSIYDI